MRPTDDDEPLLFDLPLDRPARGRDAEGRPQAAGAASRPQAAGAGSRPQAAGAGDRRRQEPPAPNPRDRRDPQNARQRSRDESVMDRGPRLAPPPPAAARGGAPAAAASPARPGRGAAPPAPPAIASGRDSTGTTSAAARGDRGAALATAAALAAIPDESPAEQPARRAGLLRRLAAGVADILMHAAVAVVALAGCRYLGAMPDTRQWPAFGVFLISFSFLYTVVPLAFWGHTLGMTWAGLTSESTDGEPLSFEQTARRWLGMLLTLATAGLPLLVALTGRSLVDRLSDSITLPSPR